MTSTFAAAPGFIGLDVETSGLDPVHDIILELGIVLFDAHLVPIAAESWIAAHWNALRMKADDMDTRVIAMHQESGLIDDIRDHSEGRDVIVAPSRVAVSALGFLEEHGAVGWPMLGSSISFDRGFLARKMPELLEAIHYRSIDATSVRLARLAATPAGERADVEKSILAHVESQILTDRATLGLGSEHRQHRALNDILQSAALARAAITTTSASPR